jgi:3-oxoacyl-[acyl-carrier-protein] synthase II
VALKKVFGDAAGKLQVSSTKSMTGHIIGASCGIETVTCALALKNGKLPPTINYEEADPDCDLDYIPNVAREAQVEYALNNSFGFGGHNISLLVKKI